jgi:hypothetical protein
MTRRQFDNGYWYATDLKRFAIQIGVPAAHQLRKDQSERVIVAFLETGRLGKPVSGHRPGRQVRDVERGLRLTLPVRVYTNDPETKGFLVREARRLSSDWKERSGARYRLNRWREAQLQKGARLTYAGLVRQFVRLCQDPTPFAKIPHGRYINFLSDYFVAHPDAPRGAALRAWRQLKTLDTPKTFRAWQKANQR